MLRALTNLTLLVITPLGIYMYHAHTIAEVHVPGGVVAKTAAAGTRRNPLNAPISLHGECLHSQNMHDYSTL